MDDLFLGDFFDDNNGGDDLGGNGGGGGLRVSKKGCHAIVNEIRKSRAEEKALRASLARIIGR